MSIGAQEAIRCENLSKHFGSFVALDSLTLAIKKGASFGFLGPNGAGKTTTLRLLAGLTHPTSGQVWVEGHNVSGNPCGFVPRLATCRNRRLSTAG